MTAGREATARATPTPVATGATCFGLRRVNPFLGVVAVVQTANARALSVDGERWQVQVAAHPPSGLWSGGGEAAGRRWFQFGQWSAAGGLTRVPLNPMLNLTHMLAAADALITALALATPAVPFALAPEHERWLLDGDGRPIALVETALAAASPTPGDAPSPAWSAGGRGERPFVAASLSARGQPGRGGSGSACHADLLEHAIARAAGGRHARWYRRHPDGSGEPLVALAPAAAGVRPHAPAPAADQLPVSAFAPLTLRTDWPEPALGALVADYIDWLSPYLLTLPGLTPAERARLEVAACRWPLSVAALWRLYPTVCDPALLTRARVEARLRRANRAADG